jgi:hypothetical protein
VALVVGAGLFAWLQVGRFTERPTFSCSLPDPKPCRDTAESISSFPDLALYPRPAGGLTAIDVRPAPAEWAHSTDPGFREAQWSAWIERDDGLPILAACYYSSDSMVECHLEETPFAPPSDANRSRTTADSGRLAADRVAFHDSSDR